MPFLRTSAGRPALKILKMVVLCVWRVGMYMCVRICSCVCVYMDVYVYMYVHVHVYECAHELMSVLHGGQSMVLWHYKCSVALSMNGGDCLVWLSSLNNLLMYTYLTSIGSSSPLMSNGITSAEPWDKWVGRGGGVRDGKGKGRRGEG